METWPTQQHPDDPSSQLAAADRATHRLTARLRLPTGHHPTLAAAVAVQVGTAAYGIAAQTVAGLVVALAGAAVFLGVTALALHRFRRTNGVRVDGLASQIVMGSGTTSTMIYATSFGAALWSAFESRWWLVAVAAAAGGVAYALDALRWWHAYRRDPVAHAGGFSPRALIGLTIVACLGLVALAVAG